MRCSASTTRRRLREPPPHLRPASRRDQARHRVHARHRHRQREAHVHDLVAPVRGRRHRRNVTAVGIETQAELDTMRGLGVDHGQEFFIAASRGGRPRGRNDLRRPRRVLEAIAAGTRAMKPPPHGRRRGRASCRARPGSSDADRHRDIREPWTQVMLRCASRCRCQCGARERDEA